MKTQRKSLTLILVLMFSSLSLIIFAFPIATTAKTTLPDYEPIDLGPEIRKANYDIDFNSFSELPTSASSLPKTSAENGDLKTWLVLDNYFGYYFFDVYELRAVGDVAEIWVQTDLAYPEGDPRELPVVTDGQVEYLLDEFENNIYPTDVATFGTPNFHNGSNSLLVEWEYFPPGYYEEPTGKNAILVSNVRDDAYYNASYPYYIAGFYSPTFEGYFDRNIISIDSHDWENRMGPDVNRPYLYESIIAHEYQHLIHDDYNPDDPSWMNEACSMFAEPLCGYPIDYGAIRRFLFTPDNSLTEWGDQGDRNILADYGSSFLWAMYLNDHYGGAAFFSQFVQGGIPGVAGIEATLDYLGYKEDFMDIYHDWRIANLIHSDKPGNGKYNYESVDLSEDNEELEGIQITVHEMSGNQIPWTSASEEFGTTWSLDGDDTGISEIGPFGSDYIAFNDLKKLNLFLFDGDDTSYVPGWELIDGEWYSGARDLTNTLIFGGAYVNPDDPTLTLTTYWDIEDNSPISSEGWDFGFVQVSTDNGDTWTSLANEYTTDLYHPDAHPDVIANLPGLTGWSEVYIEMAFDLTDYAGEDVLIGLRYVTDWATLWEGWFVEDNVQVSGVKVDFEVFYPEADFMVTIIEVKTHWKGKIKYKIREMCIWDEYEFGVKLVHLNHKEDLILIVSPIMPKGFVDYSFMSIRFGRHGKCW